MCISWGCCKDETLIYVKRSQEHIRSAIIMIIMVWEAWGPKDRLNFCRHLGFSPNRTHVTDFFQVPTHAYHPIITNWIEERKNPPSPGIVLSYLQNMSLSLPNKSLSEETVFNLTKVTPGDFCAQLIRDGKLPDHGWQVSLVWPTMVWKNHKLLYRSLISEFSWTARWRGLHTV